MTKSVGVPFEPFEPSPRARRVFAFEPLSIPALVDAAVKDLGESGTSGITMLSIKVPNLPAEDADQYGGSVVNYGRDHAVLEQRLKRTLEDELHTEVSQMGKISNNEYVALIPTIDNEVPASLQEALKKRFTASLPEANFPYDVQLATAVLNPVHEAGLVDHVDYRISDFRGTWHELLSGRSSIREETPSIALKLMRELTSGK